MWWCHSELFSGARSNIWTRFYFLWDKSTWKYSITILIPIILINSLRNNFNKISFWQTRWCQHIFFSFEKWLSNSGYYKPVITRNWDTSKLLRLSKRLNTWIWKVWILEKNAQHFTISSLLFPFNCHIDRSCSLSFRSPHFTHHQITPSLHHSPTSPPLTW